MKLIIKHFAIQILFLLVISCTSNQNLRGYSKVSTDEKTYLVIEDNNGGECGPILIDGKVWPHKINALGIISPGTHIIKCGGEIEFEIEKGTIFYFNYWGP